VLSLALAAESVSECHYGDGRAGVGPCEAFLNRYFDQNGFLLFVPRLGGDDGRDETIENVDAWPHLHVPGDSVVAGICAENHTNDMCGNTRSRPLAKDYLTSFFNR
jgi:hypothetical protein